MAENNETEQKDLFSFMEKTRTFVKMLKILEL